MRTLRISRALKECKEDKARLYKECDTLTSHLSRDLKTFEKHFGTTAQKIRAKIQRQQQETRDFQEAEKTGLTYSEWEADRIIKELAAEQAAKAKAAAAKAKADAAVRENALRNPGPSEHKEGNMLPPTDSEYKDRTGGRKTRRKRRRKKKKSRRKRKTHRRRKRRKTRKRKH